MKAGLLVPEDFDDAYDRWVRGRCPCCGWADADETWEWNEVEYQPKAIAEGVMICGRCVGNEHGREDDQFFPVMLEAILRGSIEQKKRERPRYDAG